MMTSGVKGLGCGPNTYNDATVGRRVQSWNVATQNAEKATEDGVAGAEEEEEEEEGITVRATIFN